jgi:hypothetical protein
MNRRNTRSSHNRQRTSVFRRGDTYICCIDLVDVHGNRMQEKLYGNMEVIHHELILETPLNRESCFRNVGTAKSADKHLVSWALDKTGMVDVILLQNTRESEEQLAQTEWMERVRVSDTGIPDKVLRIHGTAPKSKREGVTRLIYKNVNGLNNRLSDNEKVERAKEIHDSLEVDIVAYNEHRLNMGHKLNINGFNQLFRGGEAAIQSMVTHNVHKNVCQIQEGGTSLIMYGPLTNQLLHEGSTNDKTGLG